MIFRITHRGVTRKLTVDDGTTYTALESQIRTRFNLSERFSLAYLEDGIEITLDSNEELRELLEATSLTILSLHIKSARAGDDSESETESLFSHIEAEELKEAEESQDKGKGKEGSSPAIAEQEKPVEEQTSGCVDMRFTLEDPPELAADPTTPPTESGSTSAPPPPFSTIPNLTNITSLLQSSISRLTTTLSTNLAFGDLLDIEKRNTAISNLGIEINSIVREVGDSIRNEAEIIQREYNARTGTSAATDEKEKETGTREEAGVKEKEEGSVPLPGAFKSAAPVDPITSQFNSAATSSGTAGAGVRSAPSTLRSAHHHHHHRSQQAPRATPSPISRARSTQGTTEASPMPGSFSFSQCPYPVDSNITFPPHPIQPYSVPNIFPTFPTFPAPPTPARAPSTSVDSRATKQELKARLKEMGFDTHSMPVKIALSRVLVVDNEGNAMEDLLVKALALLI